MTRRLLKRLAATAALCVVLSGCGYTFAPQGEHIDSSLRRIYVEPFVNQTAQSDLDNLVRAAFIDQFLQTSRFTVVQSLAEADASVSGAVTNLNTAPLSYRRSMLAAEERAVMVIQVSFIDRKSGKTIWSSRQVRNTIDYELEDDINSIVNTRKAAYEKLAQDTVERAFNLMMSNF
ncbi:MAG TPA: LptE family protein [Smithellaceae bacterium]|nr:LptE family protein [Smithellaceae bacterium]